MHRAVLQKEVLEYLDLKPNENFIDSTINGGGHSLAILEKIKPNGKVLGIEIDPELYQKLKAKNLDRLVLVNDSYINLKKIVKKNQFIKVSGILFDLGMSSWHLEESGRGFTFMRAELLDMRYAAKIPNSPGRPQADSPEGCFPISNELTAEKIVNKYPEKEIEKILKESGEERFAKRIAGKIIEQRKIKPIETTFQLVEIIKKAIPPKFRKGRHFATRTFQALRIAVNDELNNLKKVLPQAIEALEPGGRIVIISFHSLEDRIVKDFFKKLSPKKLQILTKKPIGPSQEEIKINPRSRSAKLRAAIKK